MHSQKFFFIWPASATCTLRSALIATAWRAIAASIAAAGVLAGH
jgi:hypothetical protein